MYTINNLCPVAVPIHPLPVTSHPDLFCDLRVILNICTYTYCNKSMCKPRFYCFVSPFGCNRVSGGLIHGGMFGGDKWFVEPREQVLVWSTFPCFYAYWSADVSLTGHLNEQWIKQQHLEQIPSWFETTEQMKETDQANSSHLKCEVIACVYHESLSTVHEQLFLGPWWTGKLIVFAFCHIDNWEVIFHKTTVSFN